MSCGSSDCSRLCRLIDESLRPYTVRFVNLLISMFIFLNCFSNLSVFISSAFYYVLQEPEAMVVSLTKEKEQQILIALSKVLFLFSNRRSCSLLHVTSIFSHSTLFIFNSFQISGLERNSALDSKTPSLF
jgi:hypothetical protein